MNKLNYHISLITNSNIGKCIRITLHIVVDGEYTKKDLYEIAEKEIKNYITTNKVNSLTIGFYESDYSVGNGNNGFEMGRVDYVPNGKFSDAIKIKAGDYKDFKIVNLIKDKLKLPIGAKIEEGISDVNKIKEEFENVKSDNKVDITVNNGILKVIIKRFLTEDEILPYDFTIQQYTNNTLNNIKNDIKKIDITIIDLSSSFRTILNISDMSFDNGRYYRNEFILSGQIK